MIMVSYFQTFYMVHQLFNLAWYNYICGRYILVCVCALIHKMNIARDGSPASFQSTQFGQSTSNDHSPDAFREKKQSSVNISVVLLDHTEAVFHVNKRDRGQVLLDMVFKRLKVTETKFFGLQFPNDVPDTMRWLDPAKSIRKQFRRGYPLILFFRIKFYATDISAMKDDFTRYQLFLQIKLDLLEKRLNCHIGIAATIASYAVQSELGDFNMSLHQNNYISGMKFLPNQTKEFEAQVEKFHKMHTGLSPSQAECQAIKKAQKLEMYGVEIHHAQDNMDEDLDVGVTSSGIIFYKNDFQIHQFKWSAIVKISFKRKQFFIQLRDNPQVPHNFPDLIFGFHMDNYRACKRLWKSCVDFHSFYRLDRCMNSSFVHKNVNDDSTSSHISEGKSDKTLFRFFPLGNRPKYKDSELYSSDDMVQHQPNLRTRSGSAKSRDNLTVIKDGKPANNEKVSRRLSAPSSVSYGIESSFLSDEMVAMLKNNVQTETSDQEKHNIKNTFDLEGLYKTESTESFDVLPSPAKFQIEIHSPDPALTSTFRKFQLSPKPVTNFDEIESIDLNKIESSSNSDSYHEKTYIFSDNAALPFPYQSSGNQINGVPEGLQIVRIKPDQDGRYGFNVKGGADQNMPITVSKVIKDSPASLCVPQLNVGDHVLQINGRDVSGHYHDQVVRFIRSTSELHSNQLILLVSPAQVNKTGNQSEAFEQSIFSLKTMNRNSLQDEGAFLHSSMQWLEDMLESGELLAMFCDLYRRKPGSTMADARLPINAPKNRYRDISPYDDTRVHLQFGSTDYINANHINMHIPGMNWNNLYVASQGPLLNTTLDFWAMIWELNASLIIMLTTVVEGGRPKCHQYWPDSGNVIQFGQWKIESKSEKVTASFAYRDFHLYCCSEDGHSVNVSKPRLIRQMQYTAWPDHDVPKDSSDFLYFVLQVRQNRIGMTVPCIVHCSAGIGRTGVLITMETAMCLMEANQPVYPIEITRTMRDQRAMMIQTSNQFKFVCEAILRVYKEGLAKPLISDDLYEQEDSDIDEDNNDIITSEPAPV